MTVNPLYIVGMSSRFGFPKPTLNNFKHADFHYWFGHARLPATYWTKRSIYSMSENRFYILFCSDNLLTTSAHRTLCRSVSMDILLIMKVVVMRCIWQCTCSTIVAFVAVDSES